MKRRRRKRGEKKKQEFRLREKTALIIRTSYLLLLEFIFVAQMTEGKLKKERMREVYLKFIGNTTRKESESIES